MTPDQFAAELVASAASISESTAVVTQLFRVDLLHEIEAAAPGSIYPTSFYVDEEGVGTDDPKAFRLEKGFHGADSLGRVYDQSGQPHVGPAVSLVGPRYMQAIDEILDL